ncbi:MAG TPA: nuclear transport factor 2 family protein [Steroidobacteraceae bacterium]
MSQSGQLAELQAAVARLDAQEQIRRRIYNCARALDRLDRDLLKSQFWPEAQIDYGSIYRGPIEGFLDTAMAFQGSMRDTQHLVGNILISVQTETASAESYVHAQHVIAQDSGLVQLIVGGRYLDRFERRASEWRLRFRTEIIDWGRQLPIHEGWFDSNDQLTKGLRSCSDESYAIL